MEVTQLAYEAAPKAIVYAAVVVALGLATARVLVARAPELGAPLEAIVRRLLGRLLAVGAGLLVVGTVARLIGHALAAFGPADGLSVGALRTVAIESQWGSAWRVQAIAAAALLASAPALSAARVSVWLLSVGVALACASTVPLLGHGAESLDATLLHATHVIGAGLWLGTLLAMLLLERRVRRGFGVTAARRLSLALIPRFSPIALCASAVVLGSGLIAVFDYVPTFAALVETTYGRALLLKLLLVSVVGACGFGNWQAVRAGRAPTRRLMLLEAATALAIVLVTAVLTESEPPSMP